MSERIVVGIDDSQGSRSAVAWALREAELRGATITAVHTWTMPWSEGFNTEWAVDKAAFEAEARSMMTGIIDQARSDAGGEVAVDLIVVDGVSAVAALIETSAGADLLVVGSRGRSALTGFALGSVSAACAHRSECPVVIVRS